MYEILNGRMWGDISTTLPVMAGRVRIMQD